MPNLLPSSHRPWWQRVHWLYLVTMLAIVGVGLPFLKSAASSDEFKRQLVWLAVGLAAFVVVALIDYRRWLRHAWLIYAVAAALLVVVLFSAPINNARSWIRLPGFSVQPAEAYKFAMILALARYLSWSGEIRSFARLVPPLALAGLPVLLILKQPDLGTALILPPAVLAMLLAAGTSLWRLGLLGAAGVAAAWPMWNRLEDYQKERILAWLYPEQYPRTSYHLTMGLTAIAGGGLTGQGLGNGTLNELNMLPEKHNDFIFGVIAEEGGLIAAGILTALFLLLTLTGLSIAGRAVDEAGKLVAVGVSALIGGQALINTCVVTGILPTTGITLPLVSYGGSSLVMTFVMLGLVMNVAAAEKNPQLL